MIGAKYIVNKDCPMRHFTLKKGDILIEKGTYNNEIEQIEEGGEYNELAHDVYGFVCDIGSPFAKENCYLLTSEQ